MTDAPNPLPNAEKDAALIALAQRILTPGDDDNVTLGELRREYGIVPGTSVFERFPDAFDERQRPVCGVWSPMLGPCVCGNPEGHQTNVTSPGGGHSDD